MQSTVNAHSVSAIALYRRINRKLAKRLEKLRKTHSSRVSSVGKYHVVDLNHNTIVRQFVELEELGRELCVLYAIERVIQ